MLCTKMTEEEREAMPCRRGCHHQLDCHENYESGLLDWMCAKRKSIISARNFMLILGIKRKCYSEAFYRAPKREEGEAIYEPMWEWDMQKLEGIVCANARLRWFLFQHGIFAQRMNGKATQKAKEIINAMMNRAGGNDSHLGKGAGGHLRKMYSEEPNA